MPQYFKGSYLKTDTILFISSLYVLIGCCPQLLSRVRLCATPWTVAHQIPLTMGILQARIPEWVAISFSRGSFQPRDQTHVIHIAGGFFTI